MNEEQEKRLGLVLLKEIAKPDYFFQLKNEFGFCGRNIDKFIELMEGRRKRFCKKNNLEFIPL